MGTTRVTKAGAYVEWGGAATQITKAGAYVEIVEQRVHVTKVGFYVEYKPVLTGQGNITFDDMTVAGEATLSDPPAPDSGAPSANREPHFDAFLRNPDFSYLVNPRFELQPIRWSWTRPGGCDRAEIDVIGSERNIWQSLPYLLRSPVEIRNNNDSACWWGYVHEIQLYTDDLIVGLSMEALYNRIALSYSELAAGGTSGTPTISAWAQDDDSVARFGQKELLATYGDATAAQAAAVRDGLLSAFRFVQPDTRQGRGGGGAKLICRGWWHTLDWRYYANSGTAAAAISDQIAAIVLDVGEFLTGSDLVIDHTISSNEYRDGTGTAKAIIEELLQTPLANGDKVSAWITPDRLLRFDLEGASGADDWLLMPNQQYRQYAGNVPDPGTEIIGWTQLRQVLPTDNWGYMISPSPLYIVENEFDASTLRYNWRARGAISAWG